MIDKTFIKKGFKRKTMKRIHENIEDIDIQCHD